VRQRIQRREKIRDVACRDRHAPGCAERGNQIECTEVTERSDAIVGDDEPPAKEKCRVLDPHSRLVAPETRDEEIPVAVRRGDQLENELPGVAAIPRGDRRLRLAGLRTDSASSRFTHETKGRVVGCLRNRVATARRRLVPGVFGASAEQHLGDLTVERIGDGEPLLLPGDHETRWSPAPVPVERLRRQLDDEPLGAAESRRGVDDVVDPPVRGPCRLRRARCTGRDRAPRLGERPLPGRRPCRVPDGHRILSGPRRMRWRRCH
jgi:hypothetical protein